jgi:hypothetical protein
VAARWSQTARAHSRAWCFRGWAYEMQLVRVQAAGDMKSRLTGVLTYYQSDLEDCLIEGFAEGQAEPIEL